jgi:hypothetical protein
VLLRQKYSRNFISALYESDIPPITLKALGSRGLLFAGPGYRIRERLCTHCAIRATVDTSICEPRYSRTGESRGIISDDIAHSRDTAVSISRCKRASPRLASPRTASRFPCVSLPNVETTKIRWRRYRQFHRQFHRRRRNHPRGPFLYDTPQGPCPTRNNVSYKKSNPACRCTTVIVILLAAALI